MTSEEELERYKRIEESAKSVLGTWGVGPKPVAIAELEQAIKPMHTPLVSGEELHRVACAHQDKPGYPRAIGALYLRKAAAEMARRGHAGSAGILDGMADNEGETSDDK